MDGTVNPHAFDFQEWLKHTMPQITIFWADFSQKQCEELVSLLQEAFDTGFQAGFNDADYTHEILSKGETK